MEKRVHNLKIRNEPYPCLTAIKQGKKLYEGRSKKSVEEKGIKSGDVIVLTDMADVNSWARCLVTELLPFPDFGSAYDVLGDLLIPDSNREDVVRLYAKLYPVEPESVYAIGIQLLESSG
jgi:ASC-1-like (ASCH) protein